MFLYFHILGQKPQIVKALMTKHWKTLLGSYTIYSISPSFILYQYLQRWCQLWPEKTGRGFLLHWDASEGGGTSGIFSSCSQSHCRLLSYCHPTGCLPARGSHSGSSNPSGASSAQQCPQPVGPQFFLAHPGWPCIPGKLVSTCAPMLGICIPPKGVWNSPVGLFTLINKTAPQLWLVVKWQDCISESSDSKMDDSNFKWRIR